MKTQNTLSLSTREHVGEVLRQIRRNQGSTLREVSAKAQVSLGYLSEIERGQKEASSEMLLAICNALEVPQSFIFREVSERLAKIEHVIVAGKHPQYAKALRKDDIMLRS